MNNIRFTANRTNVHRTHADMFGPQDVGVNIYTHIPNYMLVSVTGAFSINSGTETDSWYRPNTYGISDDLTMVRGNHQWGFGASIGLLRLEDELQRPIAGHVQLQRQARRACPWPISCSAVYSSSGSRRRSRWTSNRSTSASTPKTRGGCPRM